MTDLMPTLTRYGEVPGMIADSVRFVDSPDQVFANSMILFINYMTKTWTLAERIGPDLYCVLAVGQNMQPVHPGLDSPAVN